MAYQPKTTTLKCVLVRVVVIELILEYTLHRPNPLTLGSVLIPVMTNDSHTLTKIVSSSFPLPILSQLKHRIFHLYARDFRPTVFMNTPLLSIHPFMVQTMINHLNILTVRQTVMHNTTAYCHSDCVIQAASFRLRHSGCVIQAASFRRC